MTIFMHQIRAAETRNRIDTLFPDCVLPGCRNPVAVIGHPCDECREVLGDMLQHNPGGVPMTADDIVARDLDTREVYVRLARTHPIPDADDDAPDVGVPGERRVAECWQCETETECEWSSMGWECDECRFEGEL